MKIIFHLGMGKTGTTSLQYHLAKSNDLLASQNALYIGRHFGNIKPRYNSVAGTNTFLDSDAKTMEENAAAFTEFFEHKHKMKGCDTFIWSNEIFFPKVTSMAPFISALAKDHDVKLIVYLRDPIDWLPSAYTQWGVRHKQYPGEIKSFEEWGRILIKRYEPIRDWKHTFGDLLEVRKFDKNIDVVDDFADVIGLKIKDNNERKLMRSEQAETILRGMFNTRINGEGLPRIFNQAVLDTDRITPNSTRAMIKQSFDFSAREKIVEEKAPLFDFIREELNIDFTSSEQRPLKDIDNDALEDRLLDYLIEIVFAQSRRISHIENQLKNSK